MVDRERWLDARSVCQSMSTVLGDFALEGVVVHHKEKVAEYIRYVWRRAMARHQG